MSSERTPYTLSLVEHIGDIFAAPDHTVLIHACNTQGKWGAGIAVPFKNTYPNAFKTYRAHCLSSAGPVQPGTCLLIEPCEASTAPKHWIAYLFTSAKYGRQKSTPDEILKSTGPAVEDLLEKLKKAEDRAETVGSLRMCKINSGKFGVEWESTKTVLGEVEVREGYRGAIEIWDREA
jgi:ADP-ribose 1''-phosphate phosphatase